MNVVDPFRSSLLNRHDVGKRLKAQGIRVIGWSCTSTPEEIIHAMNAVPVMVFGNLETTKLADVHLPINSCSFARSGFNSVLKGDYDYLDGFVTSRSCDNRNKIFDMWKHYSKIPFIELINTPHTRTERAYDFFYKEILRFKASLEKAFGETISTSALKKSVNVYNKNRRLLKKVYELRKRKPPLISGVEALEIVLTSMVMPKEDHNGLLKSLLEQVTDRVDPPKEGIKLLISGSVLDNTELLRIAEIAGGNIVIDDLCTGSRYFWDPVESDSDPWHAVAERYLQKISSFSMIDDEERFKYTIEMANQFDVDAVLIFTLKHCDTHLFDAPQLITEVKNLGLPALHLEWEHSQSGLAQLKTRIEAFIEMVRGVG